MTEVCAASALGGSIAVPLSKSSQQRAIACAALAQGVSRITGGTLCEDSRAALGLVQSLGASVTIGEASILVAGAPLFALLKRGKGSPLELSCGESGLCMRMFSPIAALLDRPVRMNARGTLGSRSMTMVSKPLSDFGVRCGTAGGRPPLDIQGPLQGGEYYLDTTESSQFLTGLLIALPLAGKDSLIRTERPVSRGYLDLTIETCAAFGVTIERDCEYSSFSIKGNQRYLPATFTVEGDWSGAAFLVAAASLAADSAGVELKGLNGASSQPDRAILTAVGKAGTPMQFMEDGSLKLWRGARRNFSFDATDCPDLFPPLAALAAGCTGTTELKGLHRLRNKESDRALSLCTLLGNLGVKSRIEGDSLFIDGGKVRSGTVDSFGDHRIAMAAAIAALAADGPVTIGGAECVAKSWPDFFQCLNALRR